MAYRKSSRSRLQNSELQGTGGLRSIPSARYPFPAPTKLGGDAGGMPVTARMECFSRAFVQAICARAGYQYNIPSSDFDSIDGEIEGRYGVRPSVGFQLKATSQDLVCKGNIHFSLPAKNYDDLRIDTLRPRILLVVLLPKEEEDWLHFAPNLLVMRRGAYWLSLRGKMPITTNSVTVKVPLSQPFNPDTLDAMMRKVDRREPL
ncbi:hypothetical protein CU669_11945 [Paramagnetospirillum kuznetsovii]|uniref:DUF4365 domain-containing protein n=1 Tax=Paramagnetospirillum kuznetsovii TaxID=2053833 RepID=A0A364NXA0_9PROT|nr:DUF4365 domain-containing protein [Paramagnetospirillum kuznetsovii]RAU21683.1 hypothetical protein CU669_11945 [Paramagnetospirillum kuznetsovii]